MDDRIEWTESGRLDEIVAAGGAHLEAMGHNRWFLSMVRADGSSTCIWFTSKDLTRPFYEEREPPKGLSDG